MKALVRCGRNWAVVTAVVGVLAVGAAAVQAGTIYVSPSGNDANDGLTWPTAKATVQAGLNAAASGDQVWVAAGTYVGCITLKAEVALYGGFAGDETDLSQRDWTANETILDGNQAGSVVTIAVGANVPRGSTASPSATAAGPSSAACGMAVGSIAATPAQPLPTT